MPALIPGHQVQVLVRVLGDVCPYERAERKHGEVLLARRIQRSRDEPSTNASALELGIHFGVDEGDEATETSVLGETGEPLVGTDLEPLPVGRIDDGVLRG